MICMINRNKKAGGGALLYVNVGTTFNAAHVLRSKALPCSLARSVFSGNCYEKKRLHVSK